MAAMLRCKGSFSYDAKDGTPVQVPAGALRPANHADVKGRESLFETVEEAAGRQHEAGSYSATVEQATAAPGEHRELSRR